MQWNPWETNDPGWYRESVEGSIAIYIDDDDQPDLWRVSVVAGPEPTRDSDTPPARSTQWVPKRSGLEQVQADATRAAEKMATAKIRKPDYDVNDLVLVVASDIEVFLGKVIDIVPSGAAGGFTYHVRVTSRTQERPACGTIVQVVNYECMRLRRKGVAASAARPARPAHGP